jgi:hypothetical protein
VIQARGYEREALFLVRLRDAGKQVRKFPPEPHRTMAALWEADKRTLEAMRSGVDVIAQATSLMGAGRAGRTSSFASSARAS